MKKADLEQLAVPTLPKSRKDAIYKAQSVRYILRSACSPDRKTLIVAFYDREAAANGFPLPVAVLYLKKDAYLTKTLVEGKTIWRECRIKKILGIRDYGYRRENICLTLSDDKRIRHFLTEQSSFPDFYGSKKEQPAIELLEHFQTDILGLRLAEKKARFAEEVDLRMEEVPRRLPKSFAKWVDSKPLLHSRYIFYQRIKRNVAECTCTHCGHDFLLERGKGRQFPTHNAKGQCPVCGTKATFKVKGRTAQLSDREYAAIAQRTKKDEVVIRFFTLHRDFVGPNYETVCSESARLFLSNSGEVTGKYKDGWSAKTNRHGWHPVNDTIVGTAREVDFEVRLGMYRSVWNDWFQKRYLFTRNLHSILKQLNLSFDLKRVFQREAVDVTSHLLRSFKYPFAPSLYRIGLERLSCDLLGGYFDPVSEVRTGPLHKQLGISKDVLRWAMEGNWGKEMLHFAASMNDPRLQKDEISWFVEKEIPILETQTVHQYATYHRMIRYLTEQQEKHSGLNAYSREHMLIGQWRDYLDMCRKLEYDLKQDRVVFPTDLQREHDKVVTLIKVQQNAEADQKIREIYPGLEEEYGYEDEQYLICPPQSFQDFMQEGKQLEHCVCANGYYNGHIKGERLIFFVREKVDVQKPFYTLEYDVVGQRIMQLRGYRNQAAPREVRQFVDGWLARKCRGKRRKQAA